MSLPPSYFDGVYAGGDDPWGFRDRWYERRKRALTLAALPAERYPRALDVGCSNGVLTALLAGRCDAVVALDPSPVALAAAAAVVPAHVALRRARVPDDVPDGPFDLVVLSEVGYYLDAPDLERLLDRVEQVLVPAGDVVACHWRHPVADYPQTGDAVHAALARWPRVSRLEEEDLLLEVLQPGGAVGVARRTGLVG